MTLKLGHIKQRIQQLLNVLLTPHWIVLISFSASAFCWLVPGLFGIYQGFEEAQEVTLIALVFIFVWYFSITLLTFLGFHLGKKYSKVREFDRYAPLQRSTIYYLYSWIAWVGLGYTIYVTFSVLGLTGFVYSVLRFNTNKIAYAIYEDYTAGIFSLRYVIVLSFGWALYRITERGKAHWTDLLNISLFVLYIAFFGRRLQLVCSVLVFLTLVNRKGNMFEHIKFQRLLLFAAIGVALLATATLLRNYSGYAKMGYENPVIAVITNIVSYLAAPFQASLGVGNNVLDAFSRVNYRVYTDVDRTLSANSAFADMITGQGLIAITKVLVWSLGFGYLGGWLYRNKTNYLYTGYPIILYAFAELWRIDLFTKGIFFTLLLVAVGVPIVYSLLYYCMPKKKVVIRR